MTRESGREERRHAMPQAVGRGEHGVRTPPADDADAGAALHKEDGMDALHSEVFALGELPGISRERGPAQETADEDPVSITRFSTPTRVDQHSATHPAPDPARGPNLLGSHDQPDPVAPAHRGKNHNPRE